MNLFTKKIFYLRCVLIIIVICYSIIGYSQSSSSNETKIIFIRHGEKPDKGDNLSCKGFNRSLLLPALLNKKFGTIDNIFVPSLKNGLTTNHSRMFQTITPYALNENKNINTKYSETDSKAITDAIRNLTGKTLLVWNHKNIFQIVKALGIKENLQWNDNDYDSIWIITYDNGKPVLKKDSENLSPSSKCNF